MAMHWHRQSRATTSPGQKHPAAGGSNRSPAALLRLPDAKASRRAPRLPGKPICSHQIASYLSGPLDIL